MKHEIQLIGHQLSVATLGMVSRHKIIISNSGDLIFLSCLRLEPELSTYFRIVDDVLPMIKGRF